MKKNLIKKIIIVALSASVVGGGILLLNNPQTEEGTNVTTVQKEEVSTKLDEKIKVDDKMESSKKQPETKVEEKVQNNKQTIVIGNEKTDSIPEPPKVVEKPSKPTSDEKPVEKPVEKPSTPVPPVVTPPVEKPSTPVPPVVEVPDVDTSSNFMAQVEQAIFTRVNQERSNAGLPSLSYNSTMEKYARIKSEDMGVNNYFSHEDLSGNLITVKMKNDGVSYRAWGENIAWIGGMSDATALATKFMDNWMNSSGHRANILSSNFESIGIGVYKVGNKVYATQEFYR